MTKPTQATGTCTLVSVDLRELKLLREIAEEVEARSHSPYVGKLLEALQPWSRNYGECQL